MDRRIRAAAADRTEGVASRAWAVGGEAAAEETPGLVLSRVGARAAVAARPISVAAAFAAVEGETPGPVSSRAEARIAVASREQAVGENLGPASSRAEASFQAETPVTAALRQERVVARNREPEFLAVAE